MKTVYRCLLTGLYCVLLGQAANAKNDAVARLNYAGFSARGNCTAVLISKNKALTAHHCTTRFSKSQLHLVFGYSKGKWAEHRRIKSVHRVKKRDVAILCLTQASKITPVPLQQLSASKGAKLIRPATTTGYKRSLAHTPSSETCPFQRGKRYGRFDCKLEPGMSGAPVIQGEKLVGIVAGTTKTFTVVEPVSGLPKIDCD